MRSKTEAYIHIALALALIVLFGCKAQQETAEKSDVDQEKELSSSDQRQLTALFMDANTAKILGNFEESEKLFRRALTIDPNNAACHYELARIIADERNFNDALSHAEAASANDSDNLWYKEFLGQLYAETGQLDKSIALFEKIIEDYPNKIKYYYSLGSLLSAQGKYQKALDLYEKFEEQLGTTEELSIQKQMIYIEKGDYDAALKEVEKLIEAHPEEVKLYGMKAEIYEELGRTEEAAEIYKEILEISPENGMVLLALYELRQKQKRTEEARDYLLRAFESPDLNIDVKINILLNKLSRENFVDNKVEMIELAEALEVSHPLEAKTYAVQGDILYNLEEYAPAREKFRKAVALDANRAPIWQQILTINSQLNDFDALRDDSEKAMELFPQLPIFYLYNGIALNQQKDYAQAVDVLTSGKNLVIDNNALLAQFYSSLGDAYHELEKHEKSDKAYEKALEYEPSNVVVLNNYAYYLSLRKQNLEKAEAMAKKANDISPDVASFQDTYGWVLYTRENYQNALFWIKQALQNGAAEDPEVLEHLGDVLIELNKEKEALEAWQKALDFGGDSNTLRNKIERHKASE
ncbi:MAG TPA: tetratricopeptide repeat protein [Cryomorphaceae bacterium]|nr:tetratricopeptide repeat protein [Cryomorphaceae bacterium]